jgi:hypothetical protein
MLSVRSAALRTGIVGGILFAGHASIPNCGSWPFVWPALTGAVAFWMATDGVSTHPFRHGILAALAAGALAGVIFVVGCDVSILTVGRAMLNSITPPPIPAEKMLITASVELGLAVVGLLGAGAAVLGGVAMMLVRRLQPSHRTVPAA